MQDQKKFDDDLLKLKESLETLKTDELTTDLVISFENQVKEIFVQLSDDETGEYSWDSICVGKNLQQQIQEFVNSNLENEDEFIVGALRDLEETNKKLLEQLNSYHQLITEQLEKIDKMIEDSENYDEFVDPLITLASNLSDVCNTEEITDKVLQGIDDMLSTFVGETGLSMEFIRALAYVADERDNYEISKNEEDSDEEVNDGDGNEEDSDNTAENKEVGG